MEDYTNLPQPTKRTALVLSVCILTTTIMRAWYNPFSYDTSAQTSAFGSGLQEERHEAATEMAKTTAEKQQELQEGREAGQIEHTSKITTHIEEKAAQTWEARGPQASVRADDTRIADEISKSKASALGKHTQ